RIVDLRFRNVVKSRSGRRHRRVADVKLADQRNFVIVLAEFKARSVRGISHVADSLRAIFGKTDLDHLRETIFGDFDAIVVVAVNEHHSVWRTDVEQPPKTELNLV